MEVEEVHPGGRQVLRDRELHLLEDEEQAPLVLLLQRGLAFRDGSQPICSRKAFLCGAAAVHSAAGRARGTLFACGRVGVDLVSSVATRTFLIPAASFAGGAVFTRLQCSGSPSCRTPFAG